VLKLDSFEQSRELGFGFVYGTSAIAAELGITKQAVSRGLAKFLRMAGMDPAWPR
jgi:hypothetical protein